jgi:hypothetical protein
MLRFLALLVLALPSFAQTSSGSGTYSSTPTNSGETVTLDHMPTVGQTRLRFRSHADFQQIVTIQNYGFAPVVGQTIFGNEHRLIVGGQVIERASTRVLIPLYCDVQDVASGSATSSLAVEHTWNIADLGPQPWHFTMLNAARSYSAYQFETMLVQTGSWASGGYAWETLP